MNDFAFDTLLYAAAGDVRSERLAAYRAAPPRNIKKYCCAPPWQRCC